MSELLAEPFNVILHGKMRQIFMLCPCKNRSYTFLIVELHISIDPMFTSGLFLSRVKIKRLSSHFSFGKC